MAEKARGAGVGIIGVILGVIQIIMAAFIISFGTYFNKMISSLGLYGLPQYFSGLLGAVNFLILFGGIYVLVHAIKRIVDQGFMAYLSTKTPRPSPSQPAVGAQLCPTCGQPSTFIQQYGRWYCTNCKKYL